MPKRRHTNALAVAATFAALEDAPYTQQYVERDQRFMRRVVVPIPRWVLVAQCGQTGRVPARLMGAICSGLERGLNEELSDVE